MNVFKTNEYPVTIGGRVFSLVFDLNTIAAIEDEYTDISGFADALSSAKGLRHALCIILNCAVDKENELTGKTEPLIDDAWVGKNIDYADRFDVAVLIGEALRAAMPEAPKENEAEDQEDENPSLSR